MKKTILLFLGAGLIFVSVDAKTKKQKNSKQELQAPVAVFTNDVDSMSYALGMNVGADFLKNLQNIPGGKTNIDLLVKGFTHSMKGDSTLLSAQVAGDFFRTYITKAQQKDVDAKKADGEKFLAQNKTAEGVMVTPSGLQYKVIKAAEGPKPTEKDTVKVHYTGTLLDGKVFDSSVERGEPIEFPLNQVIPGWTEGVQLMSVGSKYRFYIPYNLAYGEQGTQGGPIPGYATLIFDVELLGFKSYTEPQPEPVKAEAPAAPAKAKAKATTGKSAPKKK